MDATTVSGWSLYVQYYNASGQLLSAVTPIISNNPSSLTSAWAKKSVQVTTPANTASMNIFLVFSFASGWAAFDDPSIAKAGTNTNLLPNPDYLTITYKQDLSNEIEVSPNTTYSLSATVKANGVPATGRWAVGVHYYDAGGNLLTFSNVGMSPTTTTTTLLGEGLRPRRAEGLLDF